MNDQLPYDVDIQLAENENVEIDVSHSDANEFEHKRELLKKTKIVKQTWSILEIFQKIKEGKLLLNPEYQRNVIWDKAKKTAFIESLFMGIIIPPVYVVEIPGDNILEENTYEVVDGKQRLSTIDDFIKGTLVLQEKSLEYYPDWFRTIYLRGYRYNLHLRPKALLVECGAQTNTVEEEMNAMQPLADILNKVLTGA